jgi:hypothetical protein
MSKINDSYILRENIRPQVMHYWDATLSQMTRLTTLDHPWQSLNHICSIQSRFWVPASPATRQSSSLHRDVRTVPEQGADGHSVGATHAITGHIFTPIWEATDRLVSRAHATVPKRSVGNGRSDQQSPQKQPIDPSQTTIRPVGDHEISAVVLTARNHRNKGDLLCQIPMTTDPIFIGGFCFFWCTDRR